jgi:hypothetical protein
VTDKFRRLLEAIASIRRMLEKVPRDELDARAMLVITDEIARGTVNEYDRATYGPDGTRLRV